MTPKIYVDHNATTPVLPAVLEAMLPYFTEHFGNASSIHWAGQRAKEAVFQARTQIAQLICAKAQEIVFTSGGSESNNFAIKGVLNAQKSSKKHCVTSTVEHPAVLKTFNALSQEGISVTYVGVDERGDLDLDALKRAVIPSETMLISIMYANNETGTLFPIDEIGNIAHKAGALYHCDAVQAVGKVPVNLKNAPIDLLSISGHKIYGPKGIGALYIRSGTPVAPIIHGGAQERNRRAGTENTPAIVGFGKACEIAASDLFRETKRLSNLRDALQSGLIQHIPGVTINTHPTHRLPNTLNVSFDDVEGESLLFNLDLCGIAASSGSACSSGSLLPSHVLTAMNLPKARVQSAVRFSLGRGNSEKDIIQILETLKQIIPLIRLFTAKENG